ncbi:MAG: ABC transporter substrate-binding protein [Limnochordia bacterium]
MKKPWSWLVLIFVFIIGSVASAQEITLVVSSYGGAYDEVFQTYVVEPFERDYPHVKVELAPYVGVTQLVAQRNQPTIDVVQLDDFDVIDAAQKGLLSPLGKGNISCWDDLYEQAFLEVDGHVYGLTNVFGAWGIAYNTKHVEKPTSWQAFWDPALRGRIAMMDAWIPDILMASLAFGGDEKNMEPAWDALREISPRVKQFYSSFSAPQALLESEEVWMASWFDGRTHTLKADGNPIDFALPEEGGILIRGGIGVVAGSKNGELAEKFIDYSLRLEAQRAMSENFYYGPTNSTVELPAELAETVVYGSEDLAELLVPDWPYILSQRSSWLDRWNRVLMGF